MFFSLSDVVTYEGFFFLNSLQPEADINCDAHYDASDPSENVCLKILKPSTTVRLKLKK